MTEKRFVNKGKDIFQYGEWWCSANGEHCADVIATAMNELHEERNYFERKKCRYWNKFNLAHLDNINLRKENEELKHHVKEAYLSERTQLGKSVLKQLLESIGVEI